MYTYIYIYIYKRTRRRWIDGRGRPGSDGWAVEAVGPEEQNATAGANY